MCHVLLALPLLALPVFWMFPLAIALPIYGAVAGLSAVTYWYAVQAMNRPIQNGLDGMVGEMGEVVERGSEGLLVKVHNEIWPAVYAEIPLHKGDQVEIVSVDHLTLRVKKPDLDARYFRGLATPPSAAWSK
jgi:membrane protein implicated in regulation of membrane protease activity